MVLGNSEKSPAAVTAPTARWGIIFSVLALLLAGAHMSNPIRIDSTVILLCLLAIAPWVLPFLFPLLRRYVRSIEAFGAKVEFLESKLAYESRRLDDLYFLSIGDKLLLHLRKLQQPGGYGPFYVGTALPRELEHLENLGYIRFRAPLKGLD